MAFLWFKTLHLIGVIAWLAGIFYIWRLYVYHSESTSHEVRSQLAIMEARLLRYIMRPAAVVAIGFGTALLVHGWDGYSRALWIWLKLALVAGMIANHGLAEYYRVRLSRGDTFASRRFRILNEVPTLLMIGIVILAVFKESLFGR